MMKIESSMSHHLIVNYEFLTEQVDLNLKDRVWNEIIGQMNVVRSVSVVINGCIKIPD